MSNPKHSLSEQFADAERELKMRREVYSRSVARGTMTQAQADYLTSVQQCTVATLGYLNAHRDEFVTFIKHRDEFLRWLQSGRPEPFTVQEEVFR
jgi:hypothetical protein